MQARVRLSITLWRVGGRNQPDFCGSGFDLLAFPAQERSLASLTMR
jgi:hypothetical protein